MSYSAVVNIIREVVNEIAPQSTFIHGRIWDVSLDSATGITYPLIGLYPFVGNVDKSQAYIETYNIQMIFMWQDTPYSSNEERKQIISEMDILSRKFINTLYDTDGMSMSSIRTEPNYRLLSGTTSGYIVSFSLTVNTSPC